MKQATKRMGRTTKAHGPLPERWQDDKAVPGRHDETASQPPSHFPSNSYSSGAKPNYLFAPIQTLLRDHSHSLQRY